MFISPSTCCTTAHIHNKPLRCHSCECDVLSLDETGMRAIYRLLNSESRDARGALAADVDVNHIRLRRCEESSGCRHVTVSPLASICCTCRPFTPSDLSPPTRSHSYFPSPVSTPVVHQQFAGVPVGRMFDDDPPPPHAKHALTNTHTAAHCEAHAVSWP